MPLPADADLGTVRFRPSVPYRKFQDRKWLHALLFLLTFYTTTYVGWAYYLAFQSDYLRRAPQGSLIHGLWYSGTILAILGAHEMGHYLMCRFYNVNASLPYFIPIRFPFWLTTLQTGTLGAVIRIREPFPNRKALFDIGVGGPIGGFLVLVPALFIGLWMSNVAVVPTNVRLTNLGEPLLFQLASWLIFGPIPQGSSVNSHPMVMACWWGMLATALNLLPFGQLDGGHIVYATRRRWSAPISIATIGVLVGMSFVTVGFVVFTFLLVVMLMLFGLRHPSVIDENEPLPRSRYWIAVLALLMLILCATPIPIEEVLPKSPAPSAATSK